MTESATGATFVTRYSGYHNGDDPWRVFDQQAGEWNAMPARGDYIAQSGTNQYTFPDGPDSVGAGFPAWLNTGPNPPGNGPNYDPGLEVDRRENSARRAPELYVAETSINTHPQLDEDGSTRSALFRRWSVDDHSMSGLESEGMLGRSRTTGSRVLIKRRAKTSGPDLEALRREIQVLNAAADPSIPMVRQSMESGIALWAVVDYAPGQTLRDYINALGPQSTDMIKSFTTQLFSGVASIFSAGFAHLRICDETILINDNGQLKISNFECAFPYGKEKVDGLYAAIEDKFGDDIYVAPEVFATIKYNARKAAIWSCGVVLYFITTGTTAPLSVLSHPSFDASTSTSTQDQPTPDPTTTSSPSRRKLSTASQQALKVPLIPYPNGRLSTAAWTRDIISKMLQVEPRRRAELIEVAAKVPKEYSAKETRPLMELAWLDYKSHVGPLAGLNEGLPSESEKGSLFSFSGMSAFSRDSLGALLPGRRRSSTAKAMGDGEVVGGEGGASRRRSKWM